MKSAKTVGFIGGKGQMAKLFIPIFKSRGYKVIVSDKGTPLSNQEVTHQSDIIIISVPIMRTKEVIREIIPWTRKGQLLMDLTSLKTEPIHEMKQGKADVIGLHPMFGPTITTLKGQRIVMCPDQSPNKKFIQRILEEEGLDVHITTAEKHDKNMGVIQILIHFHSIMLGHTLRSLKVDLKEIEEFMSPIYKLEFGVIARIFSQDPDLYGPILMLNPAKHEILKQIDINTKNLSNIVECSDLTLFREFFKKTSKYLGKYSEIADKMIEN